MAAADQLATREGRVNGFQIVALGCVGGALPDVLRVIEKRHEPMPDFLKRRIFWIGLGLLVAIGGAAAYLLAPTRVVDALAIGFSAPSVFSGLLADKNPARTICLDSAAASLGPNLAAPIPNVLAPLQRWWAGISDDEGRQEQD